MRYLSSLPPCVLERLPGARRSEMLWYCTYTACWSFRLDWPNGLAPLLFVVRVLPCTVQNPNAIGVVWRHKHLNLKKAPYELNTAKPRALHCTDAVRSEEHHTDFNFNLTLLPHDQPSHRVLMPVYSSSHVDPNAT